MAQNGCTIIIKSFKNQLASNAAVICSSHFFQLLIILCGFRVRVGCKGVEVGEGGRRLSVRFRFWNCRVENLLLFCMQFKNNKSQVGNKYNKINQQKKFHLLNLVLKDKRSIKDVLIFPIRPHALLKSTTLLPRPSSSSIAIISNPTSSTLGSRDAWERGVSVWLLHSGRSMRGAVHLGQ